MESKNPSNTAGKPIKCKAAICKGPGEALVIEEIEVSTPKAWEARIKIICTSLCHSDLTLWKSKHGPSAVYPKILGHEAVGIVESVGDRVEELKVGDKVLPVFLSDCGACNDCKSSKSNMCSQFPLRGSPGMPRDGGSRFKDSSGSVVHHSLSVSSFSEYTVVDVVNLLKITSEVPVDKACLLSCGISTGISAAWKIAGVEKGSTVAIFGLGSVGLAVAEGARVRGASKIIGIDLNPSKFELGQKFGVTHFVNPKELSDKPVSQVIKEMTDGGADYCFECIGLASLMQDAVNSCRQGWGRTIILGLEMTGSPLSLNPHDILRGKTITGSMFGGVKAKTDIPIFAQKYLDKEVNLDDFITHEIGFEDINQAFDLLLQGQSLRCIVWMDK